MTWKHYKPTRANGARPPFAPCVMIYLNVLAVCSQAC